MIPKLQFGRTGHLSTRTLFGAAAFYNVTQAEADQTMEVLFQYGINHIDTAASYGDSEIRLGPWIEKHRHEFFLASKTGERTYEKARAEIRRSLERLRTDHLDLIQLHAVIEDEELEQALGPGGALEAALEAREEGLVRFIGITSHTLHAPVIHRKALERFDFDSVLLPYNFMLMQNPQYRADFEALERICKERNVAMQLIKTAQRRPYGDGPHTHATWYQPFDDPKALTLAIHYALGREGAFINTAGDIHVLPKILEAASNFEKAPTDEEMLAMLKEQQAEPLWA
ncbi:MAG TPA: aldo/keto reductase [Anaerolinea thermolimosa]|uniref:Aldo/keto reductase n=1 Tax=Anaerolinea thermolimosa TaxID=229919 RepID=A0A3D1JDU6_9CHLR|nr:aldo/keto reductase [Anaerolinea thermolimosa]GAP07598.1 predicted oxidoreductase related to aryl-alcohol dehydrogenases [Anaerolinea thermolimosa]HCE16673.1 aldo/keto reductase [Anaerolinea thermolimosa]